MSVEFSQSQTEPESFLHPVKIFLHELGIDTSQFPNVRFLIETSEREIRTGRFSLPLRLPTQQGYVYETISRITRILEVPASAQKAHRKFIEIEWQISEEALIDETNHAALSFLASQIKYTTCREIFVPEPEILNEISVRLSCPNCLNYWSVTVSTSAKKSEGPEVLFDEFAKDSSKIRNLITRWIEAPVVHHDQTFFQHFPFHFESWNQGSSLDWLFGESHGWTALSNGGSKDFESLFKGFLNSLAFEHFKTEFTKRPLSQLDQTEVQRKPSPTPATNQDTEKTPVKFKVKVPDERFTWQPPVTGVRQMPYAPPVASRSFSFSLPSGTWLFLISAMGVVGIIFAGLYLHQKPQSLSAKKIESPIAPINVQVPSPQESAKVEPPKVEKVEVNEVAEATKDRETSVPPTPVKPKKIAFKESAEQKRVRELAVDSSFRQGMLHLKLQQTRDAIGEFQKVLALEPNHAEAQRGLGLAHVYEQNFAEAITALSKYLKLSANAYDKSSVEELLVTLRDRSSASK